MLQVDGSCQKSEKAHDQNEIARARRRLLSAGRAADRSLARTALTQPLRARSRRRSSRRNPAMSAQILFVGGAAAETARP